MPTKHKSHPRPGPFVPVLNRTRSDGWTPLKQAKFLGMLAQTQLVAAAARAVGMSRQTAYRLRTKPDSESFAAAWDRALGRAGAGKRKVTPLELARRATESLLLPVVHRGRFRFIREKHDNSALLRLIKRFSRGASVAPR